MSDDSISRQAVDKIINDLLENDNLQASPSVWHGLHMIKQLPSTQPEPQWIPVRARPMDEDERVEWSEKLGYDIEDEEAVIYTSQLPDDGQEVFTCDCYGTERIDKFVNDPDYGCSFEENGDMDGIVAWMPLPKPWKGEE